jgi:hypothetical protein
VCASSASGLDSLSLTLHRLGATSLSEACRREARSLRTESVALATAALRDRLVEVGYPAPLAGPEVGQVAEALTALAALGGPGLVIEVLLEPLRKRFNFHFSGDKKTNRLEKPEWYMGHVLGWIKQHTPLLEGQLADLLAAHAPALGGDINGEVGNSTAAAVIVEGGAFPGALVAFAAGLAQCVRDKVEGSLAALVADPACLAHTADEVLAFSAALPPGAAALVDIIGLFSGNEAALEAWQHHERRAATAQLNALFEPEHRPWSAVDDDLDGSPATFCGRGARALLTLLSARFSRLPESVGPRFAAAVVPALLITFASEGLSQLRALGARSPSEPTALLLPPLALLVTTLASVREWAVGASTEPLWVGPDGDLGASSLDTALSRLSNAEEAVRNDITARVMTELKASDEGYRSLPFMMTGSLAATQRRDVTPELVGPLINLRSHISLLRAHSDASSFSCLCRILARQVSDHFVEELALRQRFTRHGGLQFAFDMARLVEVVRRAGDPASDLGALQDVCLVLSLPSAELHALVPREEKKNPGKVSAVASRVVSTAALLPGLLLGGGKARQQSEASAPAQGAQDPEHILREMGIKTIPVALVAQVASRRVD